ncbi:MAG: ABC transporter permease [Opitutales bacterium]|nr:ABC transporter permease [Opitutales bacterium]
MNFYGTLCGAFVNGIREILAHKMRSLLSMSGIILGVAALVAMVSIVQGMVGQFKGFIEMQGGIEKITISTEALPKEQEHLQDSAPGLTMKDVAAIRKLVPSVSHISPEVSVRSTSVSRNGREFNTRVTGTMSDWLVINKRSVQKGRFLSDVDEITRAKVCVLGSLVADEIFEPNENPIGQAVKVGGEWFTVVGVLNEYQIGGGPGGRDKKRGPGRWMNGGCYIPIHTAMTNYTSNDKLSALYVRISSSEQLYDTIPQLDRVMLQAHGGFQDYSISTNEEMLAEFKKTESSFMISLGGVAFISLFIGGIGIMNVMLAAINERIREIGVRKAVGARGSDIFLQFLVETALVSSIGGLIGLGFSLGITSVVAQVMAGSRMGGGIASMTVSPTVMLAGFAFSVGIGILSGVYPALRASRLDPIEALRYE